MHTTSTHMHTTHIQTIQSVNNYEQRKTKVLTCSANAHNTSSSSSSVSIVKKQDKNFAWAEQPQQMQHWEQLCPHVNSRLDILPRELFIYNLIQGEISALWAAYACTCVLYVHVQAYCVTVMEPHWAGQCNPCPNLPHYQTPTLQNTTLWNTKGRQIHTLSSFAYLNYTS